MQTNENGEMIYDKDIEEKQKKCNHVYNVIDRKREKKCIYCHVKKIDSYA